MIRWWPWGVTQHGAAQPQLPGDGSVWRLSQRWNSYKQLHHKLPRLNLINSSRFHCIVQSYWGQSAHFLSELHNEEGPSLAWCQSGANTYNVAGSWYLMPHVSLFVTRHQHPTCTLHPVLSSGAWQPSYHGDWPSPPQPVSGLTIRWSKVMQISESDTGTHTTHFVSAWWLVTGGSCLAAAGRKPDYPE